MEREGGTPTVPLTRRIQLVWEVLTVQRRDPDEIWFWRWLGATVASIILAVVLATQLGANSPLVLLALAAFLVFTGLTMYAADLSFERFARRATARYIQELKETVPADSFARATRRLTTTLVRTVLILEVGVLGLLLLGVINLTTFVVVSLLVAPSTFLGISAGLRR